MTIPYQQQVYGSTTGTSTVPTYYFRDHDPTPQNTTPNYQLYSVWVNTVTKGIWYLESFSSSSGVVTSTWRAVAPIVTSALAPTTSDYLYPLGQTWVDTALNDYWVLVAVSGTTATWVKVSAGGGNGIDSITGDSGGPVFGDTNNNVNLLGTAGQITVTGSPGTNTLTLALAGGGTAIDSIALQTGTTPCVPTGAGLINFNGAVVAAGTNPVRTDGTAANTMALEIQTSQALAATDATKIGLCNFNSTYFTCDANGFVSLVAGSTFSLVLQGFITSGTYTPTPNMKYCYIQVIGGGGGGGGAAATPALGDITCGGGGGAGGYSQTTASAATIGVSQVVTVGTGGAGGVGGNAGSAGTASSVGVLCAADGGAGGATSGAPANIAVAAGGIGGGPTLGTPGARGGGGGAGWGFYGAGAGSFAFGGTGGNSFFGGGSQSNAGSGAENGGTSGTYGSGGGGAYSVYTSGATNGGTGGDGVVWILEYIFA